MLSLFPNSYKNSLQKWAEDPDAKNMEDEQEEAEKDRLVDKDDEFNLQKARAWDDWKDGEFWVVCLCRKFVSESDFN